MPSLQSLRRVLCNLGAAVVLVAGVSVGPAMAAPPGQEPTAAANGSASKAREIASSTAQFFGGAAIALAAHESGHLLFDAVFDAQPHVKHVSYGPFPFFAITHRPGLSPRREFTIDSAGFWVQDATNEWLLTARPRLRQQHAPLAKGVFAFNVLLSVGYAVTAFAKTGPYERDTRGIADGARLDERAVALVVLAPAILDGYRYFRPDARWARWASRAAKLGSVALVIK